MKAIFLDKNTIDPKGIDFTKLFQSVSAWESFDQTYPHEILPRIQQAELVITNKVPLTAFVLGQAKHLKCICVAATGCDHIDLIAARELGISVRNVRNYSTPSVAQHTIGLLVGLMSQTHHYHGRVMAGAWSRADKFCLSDYQTYDLCGKTLGIIGYGVTGRAVCAIANAFGMEVLISEHKGVPDTAIRPGRVPFEKVIRDSDVISLHCPLNMNTKHLIGHPEFDLMKPTSILINVARGGLVDETALREVLMAGRIRGAGLDVLSEEPPADDHLLLGEPPCPNLIITPHVAWQTLESRQRLIDDIVANIVAYRKGSARNEVCI